ncbi:hypothetical protein Pam1_45 [Pseudanabaena phage Pam1]|nr:hypothetical protein Pam1_45 [Pseudanabaena phage Pam1]
MFASDFYKAIKTQAADAAQLDAAEWHIPYTVKIAELAQLGNLPATLDVVERIDALEAELNAYRSDYVHDLAVAYDAEGNDDAWKDAERETPSLESLVEAYWEGLDQLGEAA